MEWVAGLSRKEGMFVAELSRMGKRGCQKMSDTSGKVHKMLKETLKEKIGVSFRGECFKCWWSAELHAATRMKSLLCKSGHCCQADNEIDS